LWTYCSNLLKDAPVEEALSAEDDAIMLDLLTLGHPEFDEKMALTSTDGESAEAKSIYVRA
jgi:hypothetical protein